MVATLESVSQDSIVAIRAPARLLALEPAEQFLALADDAIARHGDVRLDLTEVTMMDACGVGVVAVLLSRSKTLGTRLRIDASPRVVRLLEITGLDTCVAVPLRSTTGSGRVETANGVVGCVGTN
jgi:anti-anti-sigma factor